LTLATQDPSKTTKRSRGCRTKTGTKRIQTAEETIDKKRGRLQEKKRGRMEKTLGPKVIKTVLGHGSE